MVSRVNNAYLPMPTTKKIKLEENFTMAEVLETSAITQTTHRLLLQNSICETVFLFITLSENERWQEYLQVIQGWVTVDNYEKKPIPDSFGSFYKPIHDKAVDFYLEYIKPPPLQPLWHVWEILKREKAYSGPIFGTVINFKYNRTS